VRKTYFALAVAMCAIATGMLGALTWRQLFHSDPKALGRQAISGRAAQVSTSEPLWYSNPFEHLREVCRALIAEPSQSARACSVIRQLAAESSCCHRVATALLDTLVQDDRSELPALGERTLPFTVVAVLANQVSDLELCVAIENYKRSARSDWHRQLVEKIGSWPKPPSSIESIMATLSEVPRETLESTIDSLIKDGSPDALRALGEILRVWAGDASKSYQRQVLIERLLENLPVEEALGRLALVLESAVPDALLPTVPALAQEMAIILSKTFTDNPPIALLAESAQISHSVATRMMCIIAIGSAEQENALAEATLAGIALEDSTASVRQTALVNLPRVSAPESTITIAKSLLASPPNTEPAMLDAATALNALYNLEQRHPTTEYQILPIARDVLLWPGSDVVDLVKLSLLAPHWSSLHAGLVEELRVLANDTNPDIASAATRQLAKVESSTDK